PPAVPPPRGAEAVPIRLPAGKADLQEMDLPLLRQVAHEDLGLGVELLGDDVQVAVPVEVEDHRGAAAQSAGEGNAAASPLAQRMCLVLSRASEGEPGFAGPPAAARLNPQKE